MNDATAHGGTPFEILWGDNVNRIGRLVNVGCGNAILAAEPSRRYTTHVKQPAFVKPCLPALRETLPTGPRWLFEVKADGWRVQLVKDGKSLRIISRTGKDLTAMLGPFPGSLRIPAKTAVLDAELVTGLAEFGSLRSAMAREPMSLIVFAFDLLHLDGRDFRPQTLVVRRARLGRLIGRADTPALQISHAFKDGAKLLAECERRGLEGVVAKRVDLPYRSGRADHWIKVKTAAWKEANAARGEMFASGR